METKSFPQIKLDETVSRFEFVAKPAAWTCHVSIAKHTNLQVDLNAVISKSSWMLQFSHQLIDCNLNP
jgi:hypothetical protein